MFVHSDWIKPEQMTAHWVQVETANPEEEHYPLAKVQLEVPGYKTTVEVGVHENLKYDILLGRDFPHLWEVGFR